MLSAPTHKKQCQEASATELPVGALLVEQQVLVKIMLCTIPSARPQGLLGNRVTLKRAYCGHFNSKFGPAIVQTGKHEDRSSRAFEFGGTKLPV